jgi:nitrile hydratase accessory protein
LFRPENPLAPPGKVFEEPWQAHALAIADNLVLRGKVSPNDWANRLGKALREAEANNEPDNLTTYYKAVVKALEETLETFEGISAVTLSKRRAEWEAAYLRTPHGKPVEL